MSKNRQIVIENGKAYYEWDIAISKYHSKEDEEREARKQEEQKFRTVRRLIGDIFIEETEAKFNDPQDNQNLRKIIVVGIRYKERMVFIPKTPNASIKNVVFFEYNAPSKHTVLKLGYAITHPNDEYDFDFGVRLAISKALKSHRSLIATSYSMLANERCQNIVTDEAEHISKNLENYV
jgi:hypothetical protein